MKQVTKNNSKKLKVGDKCLVILNHFIGSMAVEGKILDSRSNLFGEGYLVLYLHNDVAWFSKKNVYPYEKQ